MEALWLETSELGKFVGADAVLSLPLKEEEEEEGYFEDWD